jgi:hypothetical protein
MIMAQQESDRGKRATFDRKTGEVSGSGAGIGNPHGSSEDYDSDIAAGSPGETDKQPLPDAAPGGAA